MASTPLWPWPWLKRLMKKLHPHLARQTRNHILLECEQYERFRHLLGQHDEDRALDTLLGTDKGISCLAEFIESHRCICKGAFRMIPMVSFAAPPLTIQ